MRLGPDCEQAEGISTLFQLFLLCFTPELQGAAVSLFNLGQTDGDSVCGDCINISNLDEGGSFGRRTDELPQKRKGKE